MKKSKLLTGILATSALLFSGAVLPSAQASEGNITPTSSTVENTITPFGSFIFETTIEIKGAQTPVPTFIDYNGSEGWGRLTLQYWHYDASRNVTVAFYKGLLTTK
ncbi:hypothetical protein ACIQXF_16535 [Lysinibacillus sp. NPDC097231]|uniref:hypothetical protein n=1 Tax=Lysinibacillus sp. NPDC097231 TaxID=3364142 RepID=UPI00380A4FFB